MRVKASIACQQQNYQDFKTVTCLNYTIKCTEKQEPISTQQTDGFPWCPCERGGQLTLHGQHVVNKESCCSLGQVLPRDSKEQWSHRLRCRRVSRLAGEQRFVGKLHCSITRNFLTNQTSCALSNA